MLPPPFTLVTPNAWLNHADPAQASKFTKLLYSTNQKFFEADVAVRLFVAARVMQAEARERMYARIALQRNAVGLKNAASNSAADMPKEHLLAHMYIPARAFVFALDSIYKLMGTMAKEAASPGALPALLCDFTDAFPALAEVRNSAHHQEDRLLGLGRNRKPIKPEPINTPGISAQLGGVFVSECLEDSRYSATMANGIYGQIDVSFDSLKILQVIVQAVIDTFDWGRPGMPIQAPSAW